MASDRKSKSSLVELEILADDMNGLDSLDEAQVSLLENVPVQNDGEGQSAENIEVSLDATEDSIWSELQQKWHLKLPKLILSFVTGDTETPLDEHTRHSLEDGLEKVIQATDIWLLAGPFPTAVTQLAAKLFHKNQDKSWSEQKNACIELLACDKSKAQGYHMELDHDQVEKNVETMTEESGSESNMATKTRTRFLKFTSNNDSADRQFRAKFEKFLTNAGDKRATPAINLLVCGGYNACLQFKENMKIQSKVPVVLVKGSGGLADVIADTMTSYKEMKKEGLALGNHIEKVIKEKFGKDNGCNVAEVKDVVTDIVVEHGEQVFVYDPKRNPYGLHRTIVEACQAVSEHDIDISKWLKLAISLGELDTVAFQIRKSKPEIKKDLADKLFCYAVRNGKAEFVAYMLSTGVNLEDFWNKKGAKLCKKKYNEDGIFKKLFHEEEAENQEQEINLTKFDSLLEDLMEGDYVSTNQHDINYPMRGLTPVQKLIIWSIFNNMQELVDCFWKYETNKAVENATVIFRIAKSLSSYDVNFDEETTASFQILAEKYEQRAVNVLFFYYKKDSNKSVDVVRSHIPTWGNKNLITLAANGDSRDIVSQKCCQQYLMEVWKGEQHHEQKARIEKNNAFARSLRFLFKVPKGKLFVHEMVFTIFISCFAFLVLVKKGEYHSPLKYFVFAIVMALTIDEFREIIEIRKNKIHRKIKEWIRSAWNQLDILAITLFYVGFAFGYYDFPTAERTILAVDLVLWVVKFVQFYRLFQTLGPYLIMIYRMMFHMIGFILVLIIAVVAYGIFMHTMLYPDVTVSWKILFKVLFRPYLLVFGELGVNNYSLSKQTTVYGTQKISESTEIIVVIGMCVYLLVANVLLLNMLIAVFNNIYENMKVNTDKIWRFDRHELIMEFKKKPPLPIPFSVFHNIERIIFELRGKNTGKRGFQLDTSDFQNKCMWAFLRECSSSNSVDEKVVSVINRSEEISKDLIEIRERLDNSFEILMKLGKKFIDQA